MEMTTTDSGLTHTNRERARELDTVSLAILLVSLVAIVLGLIGVANRGTTPLVLIPGVLAAVVSILRLYRPRRL